MDFIIRNFNRLVEKNVLNQGISLPQIKNIYANNPFAKNKKSDTPNKNSKPRVNKKEKHVKSKKNQETFQKTENNELEKHNDSKKLYEKINLNFFTKENLQTNRKPYYLNQIIAKKMKGSLEKIKQRKEAEMLKLTEYNPFPFEQTKDIISPHNTQRISQKILKNSSKNNKSEKGFPKNHKNINNNNNETHINESHLIDLNQEIKFPEIEQSKIFSIKPSDSFITERANSFVDKRFTTRNLSYNQWMMNKLKPEKHIEIRENRIISLKEIHQKYILNN